MSDAGSLHCPNCGAPAEPDAGRCRYCEARLATVSCPACFARIFDGAAFCPHCGASRAREEHGAAEAHCPGCRTVLEHVAVGATRLLECPRCDGIWLDADVFERFCADREAQAALLHKFSARATTPQGRVRYRPCARCGKMMNRVNFSQLSGTIVDVCKGHGTYLDPGELHAIVRFIRDGGLERTRSRQLEEVQERERAALDAEARLARERRRTQRE